MTVCLIVNIPLFSRTICIALADVNTLGISLRDIMSGTDWEDRYSEVITPALMPLSYLDSVKSLTGCMIVCIRHVRFGNPNVSILVIGKRPLTELLAIVFAIDAYIIWSVSQYHCVLFTFSYFNPIARLLATTFCQCGAGLFYSSTQLLVSFKTLKAWRVRSQHQHMCRFVLVHISHVMVDWPSNQTVLESQSCLTEDVEIGVNNHSRNGLAPLVLASACLRG